MKTAVLLKDGATVVETVELAVSFWDRLTGLLGRRSLAAGRALLIHPCSSIHTFFMRFPLDVVFLGSGMEVVKIARNIRPNRVVLGGPGAVSVLEMEAGWFPENLLKVGDRVSLGEAVKGT
jgi:uncharacterized membrane protein (UPF0127 family)